MLNNYYNFECLLFCSVTFLVFLTYHHHACKTYYDLDQIKIDRDFQILFNANNIDLLQTKLM
jgi:hypothetical protein